VCPNHPLAPEGDVKRFHSLQLTALVEGLTRSLDKFKVPEREKTELLTALGGMKGQIVGAE
jgi:hypothetical protein